LNESEHVYGRLAKVLVRGIVGEPIGGESISDAKGAWKVTFVAAVMFSRRTDVPAVNAVGCHVVALVGRDMDDDARTRGRQWALVEVKNSVDACVG
jgi:hypothetical protein